MSKALILIIVLLISTSVSFGQNGWLSGTAVYVGVKPGESEAANITVVLRIKHMNVSITTDSIGDYYNTPLRQGRYCLVSASADGSILKFAPKQIRCFRIKSDKELRFDIMLLKTGE
jgi:hypothetical protein